RRRWPGRPPPRWPDVRSLCRSSRGPAPSPLGVVAERAELLGPERLDLVEPGLQRDQAVAAEPVHARSRVVLAHLHIYEAAGPQHAEMVAHGRPPHAGRLGEVARPPRPLAEEL